MVASFKDIDLGGNSHDFSFIVIELECVSSHPRLSGRNAVLTGFSHCRYLCQISLKLQMSVIASAKFACCIECFRSEILVKHRERKALDPALTPARR